MLDEIELAESTIQRDLLSARAGLLRDYDPLVRESRSLEAAVAQLRGAVDPFLVERLTEWLKRHEALVESFKSDNALLRNSLAQFSPLSGGLASPQNPAMVVPAAGTLGSAILHLTLDTAPATVEEVSRALHALSLQPVPPVKAGQVAALLAHGRLLHDLLPAADQSLRRLLALPSRPMREAISCAVLTRRAAAEEAARGFRVLLYATSVLLLYGLMRVALLLQSRALALRRYAGFGHMLADISVRLIGTDGREIDVRVEEALGQIARHVGADRAYLLLQGERTRQHVWSAEGIGWPPGWPAQALALAVRQDLASGDIIHVTPGHPSFGTLPGHAGLRGWFAATRVVDGNMALLGCDVVRPGQILAKDELGPLRLALDAVANAVARAGLEAERARLENRLQQSRRMETLGTFASGIAHNFNNIMGAILGYTEMAETGASNSTARRLVDIRRAGERASDLVEGILAFGKRREVMRRPVDLAELLAEAESLLRALLPADVRLVVCAVPDAAILSGDAGQLQQVIVNLCRNAAQAMDGKGRIDIGIEARVLTQPISPGHGELRPDRYLLVSIVDTGRGMDAATLCRIFEPFFTTRTAGHGLGLATVLEIVLCHGGALGVHSTLGGGSRFEIWLPRDGAAEALATKIVTGEGETVLLLSDTDRLLSEEELLAALGYEPAGFAALESGLAALRGSPSRFDAAIVALGSPAWALRATVALRLAAPDLPIILASAPAVHDAPSDNVETTPWPLTGDTLAAALRRCLAQRVMSPT